MGTLISLSVLGVFILSLGILKKKSWLLPVILAGLVIVTVITVADLSVPGSLLPAGTALS